MKAYIIKNWPWIATIAVIIFTLTMAAILGA